MTAQTRQIFKKFERLLAAVGVQVAGLLREGALIEIKAVAVLPGRASR
jgi:enamine deaminase RidA (YjgF/YER057c/UK114 family)